MVQQIGNTKENKQITLNNIARIAYTSGLNFFINPEEIFYPFLRGIYYTLIGYYVKRISSNSYYIQSYYSTSSLGKYWNNSRKGCSQITSKSSTEIKTVDKNLLCDKDEDEKVVLEYSYRRINRSDTPYNKHKLGLFLIDPPIRTSIDKLSNDFFNYRIVFTPKPGLFPVINE